MFKFVFKEGAKASSKSDLEAPATGSDKKAVKPKVKARGAHGKPFTEEEERILEVVSREEWGQVNQRVS